MDTLVLNYMGMPHERISWQNAVALLVREVAEVVEEYTDRLIRSQRWTLKMPSIIRLLTKVKRKRGLKFSRQNVFLRDKGKCQYCGVRVTLQDATFDHVVPRCQGGQTRWENIVISCVSCNQKKSGRTPHEAGMNLHIEPIRPRSLPTPPGLRLSGAPNSWMPYIRDYLYMHGELEE